MEIEQKEKINRAVEHERLLLASQYTTTNAEEVSRARQSERKFADENAKTKANLESVGRKHNYLFKTLKKNTRTRTVR
jgi:hypothetical protein